MTEADGGDRFAALRRSIADVRSRSARTDRERWLFYAGSVLFPLGLIVVLLGWYGASHTPFVFEQIPYMISGGLLGVGLVVAGGFLYFGYWLTRLVGESRARAERTNEVLERIEEMLSAGAVVPAAQKPARAGTNGALVATPRGNLLHKPDCPIVAGRDKLKRVRPGAAGFSFCKVCGAAEYAEAAKA